MAKMVTLVTISSMLILNATSQGHLSMTPPHYGFGRRYFKKINKKGFKEYKNYKKKAMTTTWDNDDDSSKTSSFEREEATNLMTGKKVKLLDLENEEVAEGIVMSMDPTKIVMERPIGTVYCEVSIHYANKPDAPLFVKDDHRFRIKDATGSHILWFRDYCASYTASSYPVEWYSGKFGDRFSMAYVNRCRGASYCTIATFVVAAVRSRFLWAPQ
ncbi:hypothetical protein Taro_040897 [Colocasia esculenta]|uniref:Transposase Tnp1/En/Spm-like domain-containing protein n=1 Tax=Colocasia esculenta TaxID=4460 RepID=A0A843WK19_COLES|nr:hypothetical protein [Colocasia esculenta]